jgi:hypothetical protein
MPACSKAESTNEFYRSLENIPTDSDIVRRVCNVLEEVDEFTVADIRRIMRGGTYEKAHS